MSRLNLRTAQPTEKETYLLRAAVLEGDTARIAYDTWIRSCDPRTVAQRSRVFLAPLSRNLERLGIKDAHTSYLREEWLQSWAANTQTLKAAGHALSALDQAGIATVLIKGAALIADRAVGDPGSRVIGDVDALVPYEQADAAAAALQNARWTLVGSRTFADERRRGHSTAFMNERRSQLDLHWRATFLPADDTPVFGRAVPASVAGSPTRVPDAADQLVLTCLHGVGWHCAPLRWIADCTLILARHPDLDWELVIAEAHRRQSAHQIASQLELLRCVMAVAIPEHVVPALRRDRLAVTERVLLRAKESPHWGTTIYLCSWEHARRARALPDPVPEPYMTFALVDLGLTRRRELVWRLITSPFRYVYWLARGRPDY